MNRRAFVASAAGAVVIAASSPVHTLALQAPPPTPEPIYIGDFLGDVQLPLMSTFRQYMVHDDVTSPALDWLFCYGLQFNDATEPEGFCKAFPSAFRLWELSTVSGVTGTTDVVPRTARDMGKTTTAWSYNVSTENGTWTQAEVVTVDGKWVQILVGATATGRSVTKTEDIAQKTMRLWPLTRTMSIRDGIHIGGVWDLLPLPVDVGNEMTMTSDREVSFFTR